MQTVIIASMQIPKSIITTVILLLTVFFRPEPISASSRINPIVWKTLDHQLASSNFFIRIGDQYFYGQEPIQIYSGAGPQYGTLELTWRENGVDMRLNLYFKRNETNIWEMYDLRAYNGQERGDWIYFSPKDSLGNQTSSLVGYHTYAYERTYLPLSTEIDAEIYCKECSINAFMPRSVPLSSFGFGIDFRIGLTGNETITLTTDPMSGYGVNGRLVDASQKIVIDQSDYTYIWSVRNENIVSINTQSIPYPEGKCVYDILPPCPHLNVQMVGKNPGVTQVRLEVKRLSDQAIIASGSFDVKVVNPSSVASPTPTPASKEVIELKKELSQLQGEVGKIQNTVNTQQKEISALRKLLEQIQIFFRKIFRR